MISFEKHQPTLQNPEQNPDVETMSIALEQKPLQESPEVQDQLQEAQNRADAAESTIVKETAQRDERIAETETLPRVVARKILIAAAAGLFVLGAAERAHGTEDVHPSTSTEAQWTILNAGSDVENNTAHDVDALQDIVPPNALRAQLAEAEAWDNLRKLQNKEHDLATALSVDFPYDISSQLTPEQEDALIKQMDENKKYTIEDNIESESLNLLQKLILESGNDTIKSFLIINIIYFKNDINKKTEMYYYTPLMLACIMSDYDIVKILLSKKYL